MKDADVVHLSECLVNDLGAELTRTVEILVQYPSSPASHAGDPTV